MTENSKRFFLIACLLLCFVMVAVIVTFSYAASLLHVLFAPYQFFLIGICIGALAMATLGLMIDRGEWLHYRLYLTTVMVSVFLLVVANSVIFKVLGGEQFVRRLVRIFWMVFDSRR
ncbi:MAG: hypothetical protein HY801_05835 [Candidatus Lindowbacteria bacterium]|nr:hypothetical protein [Candidatus Lindowbacteria bacterium]